MGCSLLCPWSFPGKNAGVGCHFLLQGIYLTQGLNSPLAPRVLPGRFFNTEPPGKPPVDPGGGGGLVAKSYPTPAMPGTVAHQAPLSMGFSRQEYWSGLPFPSPRDLPDPGIEPRSPALQANSLPTELWGKPPVDPKFIQMFAASQQVCWSKISTGPQQSMVNPRRIKIPRVFPGRPVVKIPHFHCKGCGFNPWSGNSGPACHMAWAKKEKKTFQNKLMQVSKQAFASNVFWPLIPLPFLVPYFLTFPWWFQHAWDRTWAHANISANVLWRRGGQALIALSLELAFHQRFHWVF